jgi:hypothetical protein
MPNIFQILQAILKERMEIYLALQYVWISLRRFTRNLASFENFLKDSYIGIHENLTKGLEWSECRAFCKCYITW